MEKRFATLLMALLLAVAVAVPAVALESDPLGLVEYCVRGDGYKTEWCYDPPITVTTVKAQADNTRFEDGQDFDYNYSSVTLLNEAGIINKFNWVVANAEYDTKLNLSIASGDLPDYFRCNRVQLRNVIEADLAVDITDIYEKHASQFLKDTVAEDPSALASASSEGKLYALPQPGAPYMNSGRSFYVRTDWLAKLGKEVPKTADEFFDLAYAFTNDDPDGNGNQDTFGFYLNKLDKDNIAVNQVANMYQVYPNIWVADAEGKVAWGGIDEGIKPALEKLQQMYKDGVIDPEFIVKDAAKASEDIAANKYGLYIGSWVAGYWPLNMSIPNNPEADWESYPLMSATEAPFKLGAAFDTNTYYVVTESCQYPEIAVNMANWFLDSGYVLRFNQVEPRNDSTLHGQMHVYFAFGFEPPYKNLDIQVRMNRYAETGDQSDWWPDDYDNYATQQLFYSDHDQNGFSHKVTFGPYNTGLGTVKHYMDNGMFVDDAFTTAPTESMTENWTTLQTLQSEAYTKIITGEPFDTVFPAFVEQWKSAGGDAITSEVNAWYEANH